MMHSDEISKWPQETGAAGQMAEESSVEEDDLDDREDGAAPARRKRNAPREEGPACQSCRRKKAKCSRQQPCQHCVRYDVECVYDTKTTKPGMRTGAIESLSQRVATLENLFLGQGVLWTEVWRCLDPGGPPQTRSDSGCSPGSSNTGEPKRLQDHTDRLKSFLSGLADLGDKRNSSLEHCDKEPPAKKRRIEPKDDENGNDTSGPVASTDRAVHPHNGQLTDSSGLPPDDLVDDLVEIYFTSIHPWIPMLHERHFRETMADPMRRGTLTTLFHAIVSLCTRLSEDTRLGSIEARTSLAKKCRQTVILESMETFSVQNLQALIICAFDIIGNGSRPSAWSIVGSMTRTVEQLQLSVEDEDQPQRLGQERNILMKRMAFLPPSQNWVEIEERRRVFWNVFLMDRFSCTTTGWNLSLTSADVKRRLPCEGALWDSGEPLDTPTPYFGVSGQASNSPVSPVSSMQPETTDDDGGLLGGFAYCIEATENLSLVTSFFLQRAVDVTKVHDVQMWLVRFKQLDLRLVQWKIFLPERWREACALNADGNMDPNLTLAHITHNTAVVLLHQSIAYPSREWQATPVRLPSSLSAETCLAAGTEVAIIAERFLQGTTIPTNPQFAFCLFICGRMMLAHAAYYKTLLQAEFDSLVQSLNIVSQRWNGPITNGHQKNLASKFATRLLQARRLGPASIDIRQTAYSEDEHAPAVAEAACLPALYPSNHSPGDGLSLAYPPLPMAFEAHSSHSLQAGTSLHDGPETAETGDDPTANMGFDELNDFFENSFLPTQRVSMFSSHVKES